MSEPKSGYVEILSRHPYASTKFTTVLRPKHTFWVLNLLDLNWSFFLELMAALTMLSVMPTP